MKKFFGVLFLLIGVIMLVVGTAMIVSAEAAPLPQEGQQITQTQNKDLTTGRILMVAGLIFFVSGTTIVAAKKKSLKKKEAEHEKLKGSINKPQVTTESSIAKTTESKTSNDVLHQLERLTVLKEKGALTEEEFQQQKKKILE